MVFEIVYTKPIGSGDGVMAPVPSDDRLLVRTDVVDGSHIERIGAKMLSINLLGPGGEVNKVRYPRFNGEMLVTDARVAVASRDTSGPQRRERVVGHIRYQWLAAVGARRLCHFTSSSDEAGGVLRLVVAEQTGNAPRISALDVGLGMMDNPFKIAREVTKRAARWRLDHVDPFAALEEHRGELEALANAGRLHKQSNGFSYYKLPGALSPAASSVQAGVVAAITI